MYDDETDQLDARPDSETDTEARARIAAYAPRACGRCCGTSEELDLDRPGEFRICRACLGSGIEGGDDDPDPGDGGLGMPALSPREEAAFLFVGGFVRGAFGRAA